MISLLIEDDKQFRNVDVAIISAETFDRQGSLLIPKMEFFVKLIFEV